MDLFTLNLLVYFVESLAIAHNDDKSLGTFHTTYFAFIYLFIYLFTKKDVFIYFIIPSQETSCADNAFVLSTCLCFCNLCENVRS